MRMHNVVDQVLDTKTSSGIQITDNCFSAQDLGLLISLIILKTCVDVIVHSIFSALERQRKKNVYCDCFTSTGTF